MCNRYSLHSPLARLQEELGFVEGPEELEPHWNVAPTQPVLVVRLAGGQRVASLVRWGLEQAWPGGAPVFNARSESAQKKKVFADAMARTRCLVPADGFFEWRQEGRLRQPYYFSRADDGVLAFGGLQVDEGIVILTTDPNEVVEPVHDRMPLVVPPEARDAWLDPEVSPNEALALVPRPFPAEETKVTKVSTLVNSWKNDSPEILSPPAQGALF